MFMLSQILSIKAWSKVEGTISQYIQFSNHDHRKFILFLRKRDYPYEYMNNWEKFKETSLPKKEDFYVNLNMEDITDSDCMHSTSL